MTETLEWSTLRERANELFGEFPRGETEQEIIDVFMLWPQQVKSLIEQVAVDVRAGKVRSGWAILRLRAQYSRSSREAVVTDSNEQEKRIRQAETWVRNSGIHLDREAELVAELFERSYLRDWELDEQLRVRMVELWDRLRPRGVAVEAEAIKSANAWKAAYPERLAGAKTRKTLVKEMPK